MKRKEIQTYKRDKIRDLYIYGGYNYKTIAEKLNQNPEFVRRCGEIPVTTVAWWINKKIKPEFESYVNADALEIFNADYMRSLEFMEGTISDISHILETEELKPDERIRYMSLRQKVKVEQMTLLADRALPLAVKKWKAQRKQYVGTLKQADESVITEITFKDRVRPDVIKKVEE